MEELAINATRSSYYCCKCGHEVTVDVEIKCLICQGSFVQLCEGVNKLYLTVSTDQSEHSESDSVGEEDTIVVRSPYESHPSGPLVAISIGGNINFDQPGRRTWVEAATFSDWLFILTGFVLEILSAGFDQVSSSSKPQYALMSLLLAIGAVLAAACELIHNIIKERPVLASQYDHGENNNMVLDMIGLGLAIIQLIFSAVQYYFLHKNDNNPIKLSIVPLYILFFLVVLKVKKK